MNRYLALGVVIDCEIDDAAAAADLARLLAPLATSEPRQSVVRLEGGKVVADGERFALFEGADRTDARADPAGAGVEAVVSYLVHIVNRTAIGRTALLAIHAGAVERHGRAIVVAGQERVGKSTLTAALVQHGAGYLTDEAVAFEWASPLVVPYPKPLSLSESSLRALGLEHADVAPDADRQVLAAELSSGPLGRPCHVGMVILPHHVPGAAPELLPISRTEAVVALSGNTFHLGRQRAAAVRHLAAVTAGAACFRMTVGEPGPAATMLLAESERVVVRQP